MVISVLLYYIYVTYIYNQILHWSEVDFKCWDQPECVFRGCVSPLLAARCQVPVQRCDNTVTIGNDRCEEMRYKLSFSPGADCCKSHSGKHGRGRSRYSPAQSAWHGFKLHSKHKNTKMHDNRKRFQNFKIKQPVHISPASFEYLSLVAVACSRKYLILIVSVVISKGRHQ